MSERSVPWFEDDHPRDLVRWSIAASVVVCLHAAMIAAYLFMWRSPNVEIGDETPAIAIELTAPQIDQVEQPQVEKPSPPQQTWPDSITPVQKTPPKAQQTRPASRTSVHEIERAPRIDPSWQSLLLRRLQEFKNYPSGARRRREQGVVMLAFSVDQDGHVTARHIVKGSGFSDLDAEVLALLDRAQPLPAFPPSMTERELNLTVPIRFSLR